MFKPSVLGLALLLSSTALWSALVNGSMSITTALIRFLIAIPVAALMMLLLRAVIAGYHKLPDSTAPEPDRLNEPAR